MNIQEIPNKDGNEIYKIADISLRKFLKELIYDIKEGELAFLKFDFMLRLLKLYQFKKADKANSLLNWIKNYIVNDKYLESSSQKEILIKLYELERTLDKDFLIAGQITYIKPDVVQYKDFVLIPISD